MEDNCVFYDNSIELWEKFSQNIPKDFNYICLGQGNGNNIDKDWPSKLLKYGNPVNNYLVNMSGIGEKIGNWKEQANIY